MFPCLRISLRGAQGAIHGAGDQTRLAACKIVPYLILSLQPRLLFLVFRPHLSILRIYSWQCAQGSLLLVLGDNKWCQRLNLDWIYVSKTP